MVVLHCFVVYGYYFSTRFIYNTACIILQGCLQGPGRVFILVSLINHFSWPRSQGPAKREEKRVTGVPAVPPLWPLTAPSNERRHSHTHVLTPSWSPFLPFLFPFPHCSLLFLPSVNSSCSPGNVFVSSLVPSPSLLTLSLSCFICLRIPHLHPPTPPFRSLPSPHSPPCLVRYFACFAENGY